MDSSAEVTASRVIVYIDGFNLYFGMKDAGWERYLWLNMEELARRLIPHDSILAGTYYFTSRIAGPPEKLKRQSDVLEALQTLSGCNVVYGKYQSVTRTCSYCFAEETLYNEKMTDVNIAVSLMTDAFQDRFDTAIVVSGDSDLTPPLTSIRRLFPHKRVVVAFPPRRHSNDLQTAASAYFVIARTKFRDSQMPGEVVKPDGFTVHRPASWR